MTAIADRVIVRNATDTADLVVFDMTDITSLGTGDGATIDPFTSEVRSGVYVVRLVDRDEGGGVRRVTARLADTGGNWQILSRRAIRQRSENGGAWQTLYAGYITAARFPSAIEAELEIGDRLRVPASARAFGGEPGFSVNRGCLLGGPATAAWGPVPALGGWLGTVSSVDTPSRLVVVTLTSTYGPPTHAWESGARGPVNRVNAAAEALVGGSPQRTINGNPRWVVEAIVARAQTLDGATTWTGTPAPIVVGNEAPALCVRAVAGAERADFAFLADGAAALPAVGTRVRVEATTRQASEACPIYVDSRPFALAASLLSAAGVPIDLSAFTAADQAVGPLFVADRVVDSPTVYDYIRSRILVPLGWALVTDAQARLRPVPVRLPLGDVVPVASLTDIDIAEVLRPWELEEGSAVAAYVWTMPEYSYGSTDDGMDAIRVRTRRQEWPVGDLSVFATKTVTIESPAMIRQAGIWAGAIEQLSSRERTTLAQRYARGAPRSEYRLRRGTAATSAVTHGSVVALPLPWHPNRDRRHAEGSYPARLAQVLRITENVATRDVLLEDIGPNATALTTLPTPSIAAGAANPRLEADVTITNAAALNGAGLGAELQIAVLGVGVTPAAADWVRVATFLPGAVPTAIAHRVVLAQSGQVVHARARSVQRDRLPSAWSTPVSVTLGVLVAPSGVTVTPIVGDGTRLALSWTRSATDAASLEVRVRQTSDPSTVIRWNAVLPAGSTLATADGLSAGTAYTVEVRAVQRATGEASGWSSGAGTTDGAATTPATLAAVISGSTGTGFISARATIVGTPLADSVDVEVATSTDNGGTWSAFASAGSITPDPATLIVQWGLGPLPNTGTLYRTQMRQRRGTLVGAWRLNDEDVNPYIRKVTGV